MSQGIVPANCFHAVYYLLLLIVSGPERDEQGKQSMILNNKTTIDFVFALLHNFDLLVVMLDS